jgi:hypothetical protein
MHHVPTAPRVLIRPSQLIHAALDYTDQRQRHRQALSADAVSLRQAQFFLDLCQFYFSILNFQLHNPIQDRFFFAAQ